MKNLVVRTYNHPHFASYFLLFAIFLVGLVSLDYGEFFPSNQAKKAALAPAVVVVIALYFVQKRELSRSEDRVKYAADSIALRVVLGIFAFWFAYLGAVTHIPRYLTIQTGNETQLRALGEKFSVTGAKQGGCRIGVYLKEFKVEGYRHCLADRPHRRLPEGCWNVTVHIIESGWGEIIHRLEYGEPSLYSNGKARISCFY